MALVYDHTFKDKYRKATATRTLELDGATTLIGTAPSVTANAGELAVGRTVDSDFAVDVLVSVTSARSIGLVGAGATVQAPPSVNVDAGRLPVSRSTFVDVSAVEVDLTATRSVSLTGAGVTVQSPVGVNVDAGRIAVTRTTDLDRVLNAIQTTDGEDLRTVDGSSIIQETGS